MKVDLCGWRISLKSSIHSVFSGVKTTGLTLENDRLRIAFSGQGQPVFIVRKTDGEFEMPDERA
jgi:hypothetical protein